jgi:OmpA-OmpF porin, OOP family
MGQLISYFTLITLIISVNSVCGQDTIVPGYTTVQVLVTDFNNNSKKGELIIFEGLNTQNTYQGISNAEGKFEIQLKINETYLIKIQSIGKAEEYSKFTIPDLNEGEYFAPMQVTIQFEPPRTYTLENVHFESGKSTLLKSSFEELENLFQFMNLKKDIIIEIGGHTDNIGNDESNLKLSEARAETVKNYLISKGISPNRIVSKGYGENHPIDTNSTPEGRQNNRRTEVRILDEK